MTLEEKSQTLAELAQKISSCKKCPLCEQRTNTVPGVGNPDADVLFIGEGPGRDEDLQGEPFVGAAGKFLTQMIESLVPHQFSRTEKNDSQKTNNFDVSKFPTCQNKIGAVRGWQRSDVFIANVVKCRPPNNRDPEPSEVETCWDYLAKQIEIIEPKLIVTLGRHSMNRFLPGFKISAAHGKPVRRKDGRVFLPLYHPAAALYSPSQKDVHLADFAKIPAILKKLGTSEKTPGRH